MITAAALTFLRLRPSLPERQAGVTLRLGEGFSDLRLRNQGHDLQLPYQ